MDVKPVNAGVPPFCFVIGAPSAALAQIASATAAVESGTRRRANIFYFLLSKSGRRLSPSRVKEWLMPGAAPSARGGRRRAGSARDTVEFSIEPGALRVLVP